MKGHARLRVGLSLASPRVGGVDLELMAAGGELPVDQVSCYLLCPLGVGCGDDEFAQRVVRYSRRHQPLQNGEGIVMASRQGWAVGLNRSAVTETHPSALHALAVLMNDEIELTCATPARRGIRQDLDMESEVHMAL